VSINVSGAVHVLVVASKRLFQTRPGILWRVAKSAFPVGNTIKLAIFSGMDTTRKLSRSPAND
jgi:hypothetical protein